MTQQKDFSINQITEITNHIYQQKNKLIFIAGASASGKSYAAELITKKLREDRKKVITISSDDYYSNETGLQFMLYGTFDHPQLIHYPQLQKDITSYIETGTFQKPHYSFIERRTTHYTTVDDTCDYMIVEGLYTTQQLATHFPQSLTIFVHSHTEELIFRRIIRDQKRVKEPTHTIIANIAKAFPMWNIYGKSQEKNSDILIHNDYEILNTQGNTITHTPCTHPQDHNKKESETELFSTHFIYNDESEDNGNIILSEHYKTQDGLLSHISIAHDKTINDQQHKNISIDIYQPGQVTPMHLLLQTAGLTYQETYTTHQKTYKKNNEENDKEMETITQKTSHNQVSYYHTSIQKPEAE